MFMYIAIMSFIGWLIPYLIVTRWMGWWIVILAILAGWAASVITGIGIFALEISGLGGVEALERLVQALMFGLIGSVWSAITNRNKKSADAGAKLH